MNTRLATLPEAWRQRRRYARLRRAMRRGTLLEVVQDFDIDERGNRHGQRIELPGVEPPMGRAARVKGSQR